MKKLLILILNFCLFAPTYAMDSKKEHMHQQHSKYTFRLAVASGFLANKLPKSTLGKVFGNVAALAACTTWYLLTCGAMEVEGYYPEFKWQKNEPLLFQKMLHEKEVVTTSPSTYPIVFLKGIIYGGFGVLIFNKFIAPYIWR